jgi:hypothetical protein
VCQVKKSVEYLYCYQKFAPDPLCVTLVASNHRATRRGQLKLSVRLFFDMESFSWERGNIEMLCAAVGVI